MIIPVRCFNCGKLLGDKYDYYQRKLREYKGSKYAEPTYFAGVSSSDGKGVPETPEARVFKELCLTRYCCKKTLLTHVDLIQKI
jgi:DNA-directed RNA polymerase subunit N (RpoN/RPB10)